MLEASAELCVYDSESFYSSFLMSVLGYLEYLEYFL